MNYSLFDSIQFNRSKLDSSDLINLVSKELRENQLLQSIAGDYNVESQNSLGLGWAFRYTF